MPWRWHAVGGRRTVGRWIATCPEQNGILRQTRDIQCIRRYYHHPHQQHTMLNSQSNIGRPLFSRRRNYLYTKTPTASLSSPSFSSSSSNDGGNVEDGSTASTLPSSSFHSTNNAYDSPMLALHMQRMQQHELHRNYKRQQQRKRSTNNTISSNSNYHNNPTATIPATQHLLGLSSSNNQAEMERDSVSINNTTNATALSQGLTPSLATPDEVKFILNELYQRLAQILQEINTEDSESIGGGSIDDIARWPLWEIARQQQDLPLDQHDEDYTAMLEHHGDLFQRTVAIQKTLYNYVGPDKIIRPGTLHRHEFVALVGLILQIYSQFPANVAIISDTSTESSNTPTPTTTTTPSTGTPMTLFAQTLELIDWIRGPPYRFELSHKQCHSVITVAAKCQQWDLAAKIYMEHIDPDKAGYIPVPIHTISARSFTMDGLFCIAHAAKLNKTLPVENVFDGVTKLMMVSPTDTESYVLSAGVALGHAGEWDALRDYLKTTYRASQMGQPLVSAAMHACILCGRNQEAMDIFDDLVLGELASAAEWQWEGKKDILHPACRDLAIRALGELRTTQNADTLKQRIMELYNEAHQAEVQISAEAVYAVISTWDDDLDAVLNLVLPLLQTEFISRLVVGDDAQIVSDQIIPLQVSPRFVSEWGSLLNLVMQICNSHQKYGLSLLCFRLFEVALMMSDSVSDNELQFIANMKLQRQHSEIVLSLLPMSIIMNKSSEVLNTTMVALCGVRLPREAIDLHNALASLNKNDTLRVTHDMIEYAEFLSASLDSSSYQSWEPAHRHIHRLTASMTYVEGHQEILTPSESILLSSALAVAIRECTVTSNPEAAIFLGRWLESRPLIKKPNDSPVLFSESNEGLGLPVQLTDSLLSSAVDAFAQSGKVRIAERLIQENLSNDRPPSDWLLSYHEAMKLLLLQGQNTDGLALFRTVIGSAKNPALFCTVAKSLIASGNWRQVLDLYRQAMSSGCASEELSILTMESIVAAGRIAQLDGQIPLLRSIISEASKSLGLLPVAWTENNYWKFKRVLGFSNARLIMGWDNYKLSRLDELDLAIETIEKRAISGLTPKNAVLFTVIQAAANLDQYAVPFNATGLPNVPRDTEGWIGLIGKALDEAKETRLLYEPNFIFTASMALNRVNRHVECLEVVSDALSRGLKLNQATLENAVLAGQAIGIDDATTDMKMLLEGPM